jgi:hypothetical protein
MPEHRVCVAKQVGCYDLYTDTGPGLDAIARSTACRSGPLGLWQWPGFSVDFRVLTDCEAPECRLGRAEWAQFVAGKRFRSFTGQPEDARDVPWSEYDIVISIDIAVPQAVVRRHPDVLWCHYFIEGGTWSRDEQRADAPQYGYNVFLDHRPSGSLLSQDGPTVRGMKRKRRAVLDFPYYLLSDTTLTTVYADEAASRNGCCLASSSRPLLDPVLRRGLLTRGPLRDGYGTTAELHAAMAASKYFVVTPGSPRKTGGALVDAVSAGCVVIAPGSTIREFRQLVAPWLDFSDGRGLLSRLGSLESDRAAYSLAREGQAAIVRRTFWEYPLRNLELLFRAFRESRAGCSRQRLAERNARAFAPLIRVRTKVRRRLQASAP